MIGINTWTRCRTVWLVAGALAIGLSLHVGCGGGSGGGGTSTNDNDNQNQNGTDSGNGNQNGNTNGNTNGNDNGNGNGNGNGNEDELTAEIGGLPVGDLEIGQQIQLRADVTNDVGDLTYEWIVDREDLATLSATDIADPILTTLGKGLVEIVLAVTDSTAADGAKAVQQVQIVGVPDPPGEASLSVVPVAPVGVLEDVSLIANLGGPAPVSATWEPSPDNIFDAEALFFENQDSGDPTLILATLRTANFAAIYELTFTITAVYSNGGSLSEEVVVTVMGGP
ncbi:MAG: hypothetical protein O7D91_08460 [Planctomycetota bacterium]|nr:hypothetical protein [Planctomycetota bacterium]